MPSSIDNIYFLPKQNIFNKLNNNQRLVKPLLNQSDCDTVQFRGKSMPSMYASTFEFLSAEIFGRDKRFQVDGSLLSAKNIAAAIKQVFNFNMVFGPFKKSMVDKIKWKSYIPQDIREYSINKINEARADRLNKWKNFLQEPGAAKGLFDEPVDEELAAKIENNNALKLIVWNAVNSEVKENNRHIPVPFNQKALKETVNYFNDLAPKDRQVACANISFLDYYTHRLRDNLLMDMNLSENNSVWVKIPSIKHDPFNKEANIKKLEILSCKNWCTRSSVDKAEAALEDGDFYIYLERNKAKLWEPLVGMTTAKGKIDQIQGVENNNIVPLKLVDEIEDFINKSNLKCHSGIYDEGPKAYQAILISKKLNEQAGVSGKTFARAIKENDTQAMFDALGVKNQKIDGDLLEIATYKPSYNLVQTSGITAPYSMFGLNEDDLLADVKKIDGNFVLYNKNPLYNSLITHFPSKLETVTGKIECTKKQYEKFGEDMLRAVDGKADRIIVHN